MSTTAAGATAKFTFRGRYLGFITAGYANSATSVSVQVDALPAVAYNTTTYATSDWVSLQYAADLDDTEHFVTFTVTTPGVGGFTLNTLVVDESNGELTAGTAEVRIMGAYNSIGVNVTSAPVYPSSTGNQATAFWNAQAIGPGITSAALNITAIRMRVYVNASAACELMLQYSPDTTNWYDSEDKFVFTAAGATSKLFLQAYAGYMRLKRSDAVAGNVTITAGFSYASS